MPSHRAGVAAVGVIVCGLITAAANGATIDPRWRSAAAKLQMPVFHPTVTYRLRLTRVRPEKPPRCAGIKEQLDAYYSGSSRTQLRISEGRPYHCNALPDAPLLQRPLVRGKRAKLFRYCEGFGCHIVVQEGYALTWRERDVEIILISRELTQAQVIAIARGMRQVPG